MSNFEVIIPWGQQAVSEVSNGVEVEMLLLQQSIIDGQQRELADAKSAPAPAPAAIDSNMIRQLAELEIKLKTSERDRKTTLEALIDAQTELERAQANGAEDTATLKQEISDLQSKLAISEQTKSVVLESNYDLERKAANKDYQMQTIQGQLEKNITAYNSLHKSHVLLKDSHAKLVEEDKANKKLISNLRGEVDGFDQRIENMRKAERARIKEESSINVASSSELDAANKKIEQLEQQITDLKANSLDVNQQKSELNARCIKAESTEKKAVAEAIRLAEHAHISNEQTKRATDEMKKQADLARRLDSAMQKVIVEFSNQTIELDKIKRENAYLLQMLDYQEMRTIWKGEDGSAAYIISCNPSRALSITDGEKDRQSMEHPVCWVMNSNGTGHIVLLNENQDELLYPSAAKGECALNSEYKDSLREAIQAVTVEKFNEALSNAVRRAQNICNAADVLDINWSEPLSVDKLLGEIMKDDLKKADMLEAQKSASIISKLAEMHRKGLKVKANTRNSATKPKRKRK
ncbi:hypothetical protein I3271_05625 [Photobacterium leiognathi]|uniref:hypothetical protein n=1 Tax=Photobacterium leiognathi TaxID=553611 RepID=UPI001EDD8CF1|nr:hypothetical protein [Photobacterium leiognathi]MCG3884161.1 hypothetical protein [Photobacterium leiognathi]